MNTPPHETPDARALRYLAARGAIAKLQVPVSTFSDQRYLAVARQRHAEAREPRSRRRYLAAWDMILPFWSFSFHR